MQRSNPALNPPLLHILRHSLGLDDNGNGREYRNHFATDPDSVDGKLCQFLCGAGYMKDYGKQHLWNDMHCYCVTGEGVDLVRANKPAPRKLTPGQQRYRDFLDADCGLSFIEFLKHYKRYAEIKHQS